MWKHRTTDAALRHEGHANGRHVHISLGDAGPGALDALDQHAGEVPHVSCGISCHFLSTQKQCLTAL